jgi:hypothetical protein
MKYSSILNYNWCFDLKKLGDKKRMKFCSYNRKDLFVCKREKYIEYLSWVLSTLLRWSLTRWETWRHDFVDHDSTEKRLPLETGRWRMPSSRQSISESNLNSNLTLTIALKNKYNKKFIEFQLLSVRHHIWKLVSSNITHDRKQN